MKQALIYLLFLIEITNCYQIGLFFFIKAGETSASKHYLVQKLT